MYLHVVMSCFAWQCQSSRCDCRGDCGSCVQCMLPLVGGSVTHAAASWCRGTLQMHVFCRIQDGKALLQVFMHGYKVKWLLQGTCQAAIATLLLRAASARSCQADHDLVENVCGVRSSAQFNVKAVLVSVLDLFFLGRCGHAGILS